MREISPIRTALIAKNTMDRFERHPPWNVYVRQGGGMEEIPDRYGSGLVRSGYQLLGLRPTPGQHRTFQVPWKPPHDHVWQLERSGGQPQ